MNKNIKNIIMIVVLALSLSYSWANTKLVSASTTKPNKICIKVIKCNKHNIKIKIINSGKEDFYYSKRFTLKKYTRKKWKKKKFKNGVAFAKTAVVKAYSQEYVTIKWKDYFKKKLRKGKYKIKLVKTKKFVIK